MEIEMFESVWDAIDPNKGDAAVMKARSGLMIVIRQTVESWNTTKAKAAKKLGIPQPRLNDLLKGNIDKFSLDDLIIHATMAGLEVRVEVGK